MKPHGNSRPAWRPRGTPHCLLLTGLIAAAVACPVHAGPSADRSPTDQNEVLLLRKELETLKHQMLSVEAHLKKLEQKQGVAPETEPGSAPTPAVSSRAAGTVAANAPSPRELWGSIEDGMSQDEISALLGPPQRTYVLNGKTVWYYSYSGTGPGSIVFNSDKHASSHQVPGFWPW